MRLWISKSAAGVALAVAMAGAGCRSTSSSTSASAVAAPAGVLGEVVNAAASLRIAKAHAQYAAGVIHALNDEPEKALEAYRQAALADLGDETLVLEVARRFAQAKQPDKALEILSRATARGDASAEIWALQGFLLNLEGRESEAAASNRKAIEKSPDLLAGYRNLYFSLVQKGKEQEAEAVLDRAASQAEVSPEFSLGLAELYANLGVRSNEKKQALDNKALEVLARVEQLPLESPGLRLALAEQLFTLGAQERAAEAYHRLLETLPENGNNPVRDRVHARLSEIYLRAEDHTRAVEQLEAILKSNPANMQAHYFLGNIAMEQRKPIEAVEHLRRAIVLNPELEQAYYDLANAQVAAEQPSDALATLDDARKRFPQNFLSEFLRAVAYIRQKSYDQAVKLFGAAEILAQASDPKRLNHFFYFQYGAAAERDGDFTTAEKHFRKALTLNPDFHEAQNYLGYMWAERGTNLTEALELIEKAVKAEPDNEAYLDSLGWVLFQLGKPAESLPHILRAIELSKEPDATLLEHLGDVHFALKDGDKAREAWEKSLAVEDKTEVRAKLEKLRAQPEHAP